MLFVTRNKATGRIPLCVLVSYVFLMLSAVVITREFNESFRYELVPFWSYMAIINESDVDILPQIIANIVFFIPIGILCPYVFNNKGKSILIGFLFSCIIEVIQLVFRLGLFEFDDIIHNTLGTVIGYGIYVLIEYIRTRVKEHDKRKHDI